MASLHAKVGKPYQDFSFFVKQVKVGAEQTLTGNHSKVWEHQKQKCFLDLCTDG